jgi:hypothetical protein
MLRYKESEGRGRCKMPSVLWHRREERVRFVPWRRSM